MSEETKITKKRSTEVLYEIHRLKDNMVQSVFSLGRLLLEARDGNYNLDWGYTQFKDWIEDASGLDMGWRQAYYLMNIMERSAKMGYTDEDLAKIKMSSLKEIFSVEDDNKVKELMAGGESMSLEEVKTAVNPERKHSFMNIKFLKEDKQTVLEAIEKIRRLHGSTINEHGEVVDISEGRAIVLMAELLLQEEDKNLALQYAELKEQAALESIAVEGSDELL